ncbi:hypothetical protein [Arthrobacter sp. MYb213]|uniref:hypothetical protein n=1 Tax=Arthrobacter sp. MYb213 TaxID=1848595 RepID=UPI0015E33BCB|nr:hypothetical protein [Arthrobacter sp. MYb213]
MHTGLRGEDIGDDRLADIASGAGAETIHHLAEGLQPANANRFIELRAGEGDMFAQRGGNFRAVLEHLRFHELFEHGHA